MNYEILSTGRDSLLHGQLWGGADWPARPLKGVLILVHGLGDHADRFAGVADAIAEGWAVYAFDLPGHGRSPGEPGKSSGYSKLLADVAAASQTMSDRFGDLPQVILGHSMGGNLAVNYVLRRDKLAGHLAEPAALVLCSPMLLPPQSMPRPLIFAAWLTGYVFPFIRFGHQVDPRELTSDPSEIQAIENDAKMHSKISMHLATQLVAQGRWAIDQARQLKTPTLIMHGEDDAMIDQAACKNYAIRIGQSATLETFSETKHAIFHDRRKDDVIERLNQWLESTIK
jgi:alpha-beta hydrolase superfamily lysophospholipase